MNNPRASVWAYSIGALLVLALALAGCTAQASTPFQLRQLAGPPPSSLDQYFPPKAPAPQYLIDMFALAGPFEGIGVDLQEGDMPNLKPNFQAFQDQYTKVSKMVPEWASRFPNNPVNDLRKAIDRGNPAAIGQAMGAVGKVCSDCHLVYQVKVEQQYHWRDFEDIKVTNPILNKQQNFGDYMTTMAGGFEGALVDLQEGQLDKAKANFSAFQSQFETLAKDGCKQCHSVPGTNPPQEIPRKYYVDTDSMALINQMGQALNSNDATAIGNLSGAIGNSICLNCHLVHLPAQNAKDIWSQFNDLLK